MSLTVPIYLDNQSTTRVDPCVVDAMLPYFSEQYGNAGSTSHGFGWDAKEAVEASRRTIAEAIGAGPREIVFTSGATESNNLAIRGVAEWPRRRGNHIVSVATEHKAVLDPLDRLLSRGFEITLLPITPDGNPQPGLVTADQVADAIRPDTVLVSVMLANNEIGVIQPIAQIGQICKQQGVLFHSDATQAVGKLPIDVEALQVDLLSFSAHKLYGPKGIGALYVRRRNPQVRLLPLMDGGGQEAGRRSGTINVPGCVGFAKATEISLAKMDVEQPRLAALRQELYEGFMSDISDVRLNGPELDDATVRLAGNLNMRFRHVEGESLMISVGDVAVSSGSACTSANPEPSHVLRSLGLSDDDTRSSVRFGIGRFNTQSEIEYVVKTIAEAVWRLRAMSSLA